MENQIEYQVFSLPAAVMLQHQLPQEVVTNLNDYLDVLRSSEQRESASADPPGRTIENGLQRSDFTPIRKYR